MELSKRLRAVASLVTEGASVADIGTDHGYIPIYLVLEGISPKVIASDINPGPLEMAKAHIKEFPQAAGHIETRLSDGLAGFVPGEADTMIAAGMGGGLTIRILDGAEAVTDQMDCFILQPQSEIGEVRRYLNSHGFCIEKEDMVVEDGKYYTVMRVIHGDREDYSEEEYIYGKRLLESRHPVLKEYLLREMRIKEKITEQIEANGNLQVEERLTEIKSEKNLIEKALLSYGAKEEESL